jgi:hypothetical protein
MSSGPSSSKIGVRNSPTWDSILTIVSVVLQVEIFGNSSATNYKLDHITCSDAFSFLVSASQFMSIVTVKWYTFYVNISQLVTGARIWFLRNASQMCCKCANLLWLKIQ